jgi:hypothetical protein
MKRPPREAHDSATDRLARSPKAVFMEVRTSSTIANQLSELGVQVKIRIGKTSVVGILNKRCRTAGHLPSRYGRQCGLGGNRSPLCQQDSCPEGVTEPRRL